MATIAFDQHSILIDGRRKILISGAVHYPRSTPSMWPKILYESKRAGLNCIDTYVFWEGHEPQEGRYEFSGRFDLCRFLDICHKEGLYVILRIGPYVCAEWNFGGLPWWLLKKKGIVTRTWNKPFMEAVERWVNVLLQLIGEYQITRGGPIIMAQMENEYTGIVAKRNGRNGRRYLAWISEIGRKAGLEVPLNMCNEGIPDDVIETINSFSAWSRVEELRTKHPSQPALWTENWTGWYDVWCQPHHLRDSKELAYEILRFFAAGGSGVNYYMWHGGTNFGRDAMYLQTTSYDFEAPIDEYGLPTQKFEHLRKFHLFLHNNSEILLKGKKGKKEILVKETIPDHQDGVYLYSFKYKGHELDFVISASHKTHEVAVCKMNLTIPEHGALALIRKGKSGHLVYRTWDSPRKIIIRKMAPAGITLSWQMIEESLPGKNPDYNRRSIHTHLPHNMLLETLDETDFGWYRAVINSSRASKVTLNAYVADILSVWVNGIYIGSTPLRLDEMRPKKKNFEAEITIPLKRGKNEILLLVTALGLIKHDLMINAPQSKEKKGLRAPVFLDGKKISKSWEFSPGLWGEHIKLFEPGPASMAKWNPVSHRGNPLRWYYANFLLDKKQLCSKMPWALEIGSLFKGTIWINGQMIGRYWQESSPQSIDNESKLWFKPYVLFEGLGKAPQRYYHIPIDWLNAGLNTIIILEERGRLPEKTTLVQRR